MRFFFIVVLCGVCFIAYGQSLKKIDSLQQLIDKEVDSKIKIELLNRLSFEFFDFDVERAGPSTQLALQVAQSVGDEPGKAWATAYRGVYFLLNGSLSEAHQKLVQSQKFGIDLQDNNLQAYSLIQLGNVFRDKGVFDSSYMYYKQAEKVILRKPDVFYQSIVKMNLGRYYLILSKPDSALLEVKEALRLRESMNDPKMLPDVWILLGNCHREMYDHGRAESYYNLAVKGSPPSSVVNGKYLFSMGEIYFTRGELDHALKNWIEALGYIRKLNYKYELANLYYRIGEAYEEQGHYSLTIKYLSKSLTIAEKSPYQYLEAEVYYELAWVSFRTNNWLQAKQSIEKAQLVFKRANQELKLAGCLNVQGLIQMKMGNYDSSLYYHQLSLKARTRMGDKVAVSSSLYNMADLFNYKKEYTKALHFLWKGVKIDEALGDNIGRSSYYYLLGRTHKLLGTLDSTKFYLDKALELAIPTTASDVLRSSYFEMADYLQEVGKPNEAISFYKKFIALSDTVFGKQTTQNLAAFRTLYEVEDREQEIALLNKDNLLAKAQADKQKIQFYVVVMGLLILIVLAAFYYRFASRLKKLNVQISEKGEEIQAQSEELGESNVALSNLNQDLEKSNDNVKQALEDLQKTQEQLIQSEKMASLGVLSSGVAHELNNPLNFIKGGVNALGNELKDLGEPKQSEIKTFIDIINEGVNRASVILKGLSHYSRQSDQQNEECDIHKILENCLVILSNRLKHRITVEKFFASEPSTLTGNEGKLHQAFINILSNAEQAIQGEGTIRIRTGITEGQKFISIEDTGMGISEENLKRIGDPFFTTKAPGEGTGLGLSIAYMIIENHGGEVSVTSEINKGTKFLLLFG